MFCKKKGLLPRPSPYIIRHSQCLFACSLEQDSEQCSNKTEHRRRQLQLKAAVVRYLAHLRGELNRSGRCQLLEREVSSLEEVPVMKLRPSTFPDSSRFPDIPAKIAAKCWFGWTMLGRAVSFGSFNCKGRVKV